MKIEKNRNTMYCINEEKKTVACVLTNCRGAFVNKVFKHVKHLECGYLFNKATDLVKDEYSGIAYCAADDNFNVEIGKKIALSRAVVKRSRAYAKAMSKIRKELMGSCDNLFVDGCNEIDYANSKEMVTYDTYCLNNN